MTWDEAAPLIQRALDRAPLTHTVADVRELIEAEQARAWVGERSVVVGQTVELPRAKILNQWLAAGDLHELLAMRPLVERDAVEMGCSRLTLAGRGGWSRVLAPYGYREAGTLFYKEL